MADLDLSVGRWAVVHGYSGPLTPDIFRIDAATDKLIKSQRDSGRFDQKPKTAAMATFGTKQEARDCVDAIRGIAGEMRRREQAAREAANTQLSALLRRLNP